jgi:hypothetical protein
MSSSGDPFGFKPRKRAQSTRPTIVVAQPGQEVRIVVPDESGFIPGVGDSRASPRGSGDSRVSPRGSGDSRVSPKGSGDSRVSPKGSGDMISQDPFGFKTYRRGFSPSPITIVAQSGQEIRIVVPDESGAIPGVAGDSRVSPRGSGDSRQSPKGSG